MPKAVNENNRLMIGLVAAQCVVLSGADSLKNRQQKISLTGC
jgi:hypothetical protein